MSRTGGLLGLGLLLALAGCGTEASGNGGAIPSDDGADGGDSGTMDDGDGTPGDGTPGDGTPGGDGPDAGDGDDGPGGGQVVVGGIKPPLGASCGGKAKAGVKGDLPSFAQQEISAQTGAAYLWPADLNGDEFPEFLLTSLSVGVDLGQVLGGGIPLDYGGAYVLSRTGGKPDGTLGSWTSTEVFGKDAQIGFPNSSEHYDLDGDDVADWILGAGFLIKPVGKLVWMKGAADGTFGAPQQIPVPDAKCWYHNALGLDMDADGDNDFVTSCHVGDTSNTNGPSRVEWFENEGGGQFTSHAIADGGGALISLYDLDADGDLDVVAPQFFGPEALVWFEQTGAKGSAWTKHIINTSTGRGFKVKFADMDGDGDADMVYGNHNNQQADDAINQTMGIYWFEIPKKDAIRSLESWDEYIHVVHEGFMVPPASGFGAILGMSNKDSAGAPGMMNVGDIDGDCDFDVTASGDGDHGLYVFIQQDDGFEKIELSSESGNENSGEQHMVDLDGDGDLDVIWAVFGPSGGTSLSSHVYAFLQQ